MIVDKACVALRALVYLSSGGLLTIEVFVTGRVSFAHYVPETTNDATSASKGTSRLPRAASYSLFLIRHPANLLELLNFAVDLLLRLLLVLQNCRLQPGIRCSEYTNGQQRSVCRVVDSYGRHWYPSLDLAGVR